MQPDSSGSTKNLEPLVPLRQFLEDAGYDKRSSLSIENLYRYSGSPIPSDKPSTSTSSEANKTSTDESVKCFKVYKSDPEIFDQSTGKCTRVDVLLACLLSGSSQNHSTSTKFPFRIVIVDDVYNVNLPEDVGGGPCEQQELTIISLGSEKVNPRSVFSDGQSGCPQSASKFDSTTLNDARSSDDQNIDINQGSGTCFPRSVGTLVPQEMFQKLVYKISWLARRFCGVGSASQADQNRCEGRENGRTDKIS